MVSIDSHAQLRALYNSLQEKHERFDEFKAALAAYEAKPDDDEPEEAFIVRQRLNERIRTWVSCTFDGLTPTQMVLWRRIIIEERYNVALSPWKESNAY
jgi:hypothetical protein